MRVLREPLLHFLLAGAALFIAYSWVGQQKQSETGRAAEIRISTGDIRWLQENWTTQWRRPPTPDEFRGLVSDYLNEQLLAREARALGLEDNDVIIRRRLAQKLTFLIDDTARLAEPTEQELQEFYVANASRFRTDGLISFRHIYFNAHRRPDARSDAASTLTLLIDAEEAQPIEELGDRLLVDSDLRDETEQSVSNLFGPDFAQSVFALRAGVWSGPVESGYGLHLVRVSGSHEGRLPSLQDIRDRVVELWKREQEQAAKNQYLAELQRKYRIAVDDEVKPLIATAAARSASK